MTFILTLGNLDQVIQVSDRRLTSKQGPVDEEQNKTGSLVTADGRFAFAFTGLARVGAFNTRDWLIAALPECGAPTYESYHVFEDLKRRATNDFRVLPELREAPAHARGLTIIFAGYLYRESPPRLAYAVLSNAVGADGIVRPDIGNDFVCDYRTGQPANRDLALVKPLGFLPAMKPEDGDALLNMLASHKPAHAILGKAIEVVRMLADRPEARSTIGKQLCSITLSVNLNVAASSDYHSNIPTATTYIPDIVFVTPSQRGAISNISIAPVEQSTAPSVGPKLGRNRHCFCGSGKKYKRCHGRSRKY